MAITLVYRQSTTTDLNSPRAVTIWPYLYNYKGHGYVGRDYKGHSYITITINPSVNDISAQSTAIKAIAI